MGSAETEAFGPPIIEAVTSWSKIEPWTDSLIVALDRGRFEFTFVNAMPSLELTVLSGSTEFVQSVLHNLAGVKSCFLKLSQELEWRNNDI